MSSLAPLTFSSYELAREALAMLNVKYGDLECDLNTDVFESNLVQRLALDKGSSMSKNTRVISSIMNATECIPEGCAADSGVFMRAIENYQRMSGKDTTAVFYIQRSQKNTPSFMFGYLYSSRIACKSKFDEIVSSNGEIIAPSMILFVIGHAIVIPTITNQCIPFEELLPRVIAQVLFPERSDFRCSKSGESLIEKVDEFCMVHLHDFQLDDDGNLIKAPSIVESCNALSIKD